jgi:hypothetical protein
VLTVRLIVCLAFAVALAAPASAGELQLVGLSRAGALAIDLDHRLPEHPGHYDTRSELILAAPIPSHGQLIQRIRLDEEWECVRGEHRIVRASYYTASGRYLRSDPVRAPWRAVRAGTPLAEVMGLVCAGRPIAGARRFEDVDAMQAYALERLTLGAFTPRAPALVAQALAMR